MICRLKISLNKYFLFWMCTNEDRLVIRWCFFYYVCELTVLAAYLKRCNSNSTKRSWVHKNWILRIFVDSSTIYISAAPLSLHILAYLMLLELHINTINNNYAKHQVTAYTMVSVVWTATEGVLSSVLTLTQGFRK